MTQPEASPLASGAFNIQRILLQLPHRYPFLLVDRVVDYRPMEWIKAYKCVSFNEPFFQGHFPEKPVMPGVLIMEALAQAGGLMVFADCPEEKLRDSLFLFTGMESVRFRNPVFPGDRLDLECTLTRSKMRLWKMSGKAYVDGKLAAEGNLTAALMPREAFG